MMNAAELSNKTPSELKQIIIATHKKLKEKEVAFEEKEKQLKAELGSKQQTIQHLYEAIRLLKHDKFGARSEKYSDNNFQGRLFDEASVPDNVSEIEGAEKSITVPAHVRKKPGRKPLSKDLPRIEVIHDLNEAEKHCPCGGTLTCIGDERSEQLDIVPATIQVLVHVHKKYACKGCQETIKTAQKPKQPIPQSIATPGLLAHVLTQKFQFHLPLYRQEQMLNAIGVDIPRATLSHWVIKCSALLQPLVNLLEDEILAYDVAFADESTLQVLKEPGKAATSQSYMWCFAGGKPARFSLVYHYHPNRSHQKAVDFFVGYAGYLHCDGYQAYDTVSRTHPKIKQVGCWYHVRRKFVEATKVSKKAGVATYIVKQIRQLSHIEKVITTQEYDAERARAYRQTHAYKPIEKIKAKLEEQQHKVSAQSTLGKAIHYTLNQWPKLLTYLEDGRLEISNNRMERAIKPFVTGRKNWLFANCVKGAKAAAIIFSLIETCKAHEVNVYAWFRNTLDKIPSCETVEDYEALLPFNFKKSTCDESKVGV